MIDEDGTTAEILMIVFLWAAGYVLFAWAGFLIHKSLGLTILGLESWLLGVNMEQMIKQRNQKGGRKNG